MKIIKVKSNVLRKESFLASNLAKERAILREYFLPTKIAKQRPMIVGKLKNKRLHPCFYIAIDWPDR